MASTLNNTWRVVRETANWHVTSQHIARRNALVAATMLADRRRERIDVEEFLATRNAARVATVPHPGVRRLA
jgi:hypothetical protein